jgi:hypothetical protein
MPDNFVTNAGSGGSTFAADDLSSVLYPRLKLIHGADGSNDGDIANTNPLPIKIIADAARGLDIFRSLDLDETEEDVKTSAGTVYWLRWHNRAAAERFLKFYNATAATVVVGTTTPVITIPLAAGNGETVAIPHGLFFSTAICVAATTGVADSDTGAPAANDVVINLGYK